MTYSISIRLNAGIRAYTLHPPELQFRTRAQAKEVADQLQRDHPTLALIVARTGQDN